MVLAKGLPEMLTDPNFICFNLLSLNTLWLQFVEQQWLMQTLTGAGLIPIFIVNTLWMLVHCLKTALKFK
jgi:hypothetical protein